MTKNRISDPAKTSHWEAPHHSRGVQCTRDIQPSSTQPKEHRWTRRAGSLPQNSYLLCDECNSVDLQHSWLHCICVHLPEYGGMHLCGREHCPTGGPVSSQGRHIIKSPCSTRYASLAHSLTHSLTHSLARSLTHSLTSSLTRSLPPSLPPSLTHSLSTSLTHSLTRVGTSPPWST